MLKGKHAYPLAMLFFAVIAISAVAPVNTVKAYDASANWHTSYAWPPEWDDDWPDETDVSSDVVYYVATLYYGLDYGWVMFNDDPYVSASSIYGVADQMDDYAYATVFIYMHGSNFNRCGCITNYIEYYWVPVEHYQGFTNGGYTYDYTLYQYTSNAHHYFAFIWTCASGKQIGYYDEDAGLGDGWMYFGTGAVGWTYAWTRQNEDAVSSDGYANADETDYCFIGFDTFSPPLSDDTGYSTKTYANFVETFYYSALVNQSSIIVSLNNAAYEAFGEQSFSNTKLYYGWEEYLPDPVNSNWTTCMHVYGNGNNYLPTG
jgi:hypothetical protein